MKRGFTLLEVMVACIIIGILALTGYLLFGKMVEGGRARSEAKNVLLQIKTAWVQYQKEIDPQLKDLSVPPNGFEPATMKDLGLMFPEDSCNDQYYFKYKVDNNTAIATRCVSGGKAPQYRKPYNVTLNMTAVNATETAFSAINP